MPSITGGGGYIPQPIQPQRPMQQAAPVQAQAAREQTLLAPKDVYKGPSQTSLTSQVAEKLTSDGTKAQIHRLIETATPRPPADPPALAFMERPAMSSALAGTLAEHHLPEQQQAQQQAQQPGANQQAQQAAGQFQTSTLVRNREHTEDSVARNSLQSGKRLRKQEQEGEFSSLDDFGGGGGMSGDQSGQDQRSDSQKKKQILTVEEKRKAPPGAAQPTQRPAPPKPTAKPTGPSHMKAAVGPLGQAQRPATSTMQPRKEEDKPFSGVAALPNANKPPGAPKPGIQRVQPPLSQQQKPVPPKKPTDEWSF